MSTNVIPSNLVLNIGKSFTGAVACNVGNAPIKWHSNNESIATVNSDSGEITAKAPGTAIIQATSNNGSVNIGSVTVTVPVTSYSVLLNGVAFNKTQCSVSMGNSERLITVISPTNASEKSLWWYSSNEDVATVDSNGTIRTVSVGNATIMAVSRDGSGLYATCEVSVNEVLAIGVLVNPPSAKISIGETVALSAFVHPSNSSIKTVSWSSADTSIAEVNSAGVVTAKSAGTTTIFATVQDGRGVVGTCSIEVDYPMWTCYHTNNNCYIKGTPIGTVAGIVVHSTGAPNPNLRRYVDDPSRVGVNNNGNHWNSSDAENMVHAFIGLDINQNVGIVNILPYEYACWGVGNGSIGSYNYSPHGHIQFEICEDNLTNEDYFNNAVWGAAVQYCAYLCGEFNLSVSSIVSHQEAYQAGYGSNHADPHHWLAVYGKTMNDFRNAVQAYINAHPNN